MSAECAPQGWDYDARPELRTTEREGGREREREEERESRIERKLGAPDDAAMRISGYGSWVTSDQ